MYKKKVCSTAAVFFLLLNCPAASILRPGFHLIEHLFFILLLPFVAFLRASLSGLFRRR